MKTRTSTLKLASYALISAVSFGSLSALANQNQSDELSGKYVMKDNSCDRTVPLGNPVTVQAGTQKVSVFGTRPASAAERPDLGLGPVIFTLADYSVGQKTEQNLGDGSESYDGVYSNKGNTFTFTENEQSTTGGPFKFYSRFTLAKTANGNALLDFVDADGKGSTCLLEKN